MYRFFLDSELINDPGGWDELETRIFFDESRRFIKTEVTGTLEFTDEAYNKMRNQISEERCAVYDIIVEEDCGDGVFYPIIKGKIFLTDVKFNLCKCTANVKITDDSISAMIENNLSVPVRPTSLKTKTGETDTLTAVPSVDINVTFSEIGGGTSVNVDIRTYELLAVLKKIVSTISDEQLTFRSDFIASLDYKIGLTSGLNVRKGASSEIPFFNFGNIIDWLVKDYNMVMFAEGDVIRLESLEYIENLPTSVTVQALEDLNASVDTSKLYSIVKVGNPNEVNTNNSINAQLVRGDCVQHRVEDYTFQTQCNTSNVLDLTHDLITSHNTFNAIAFGDDSYDTSTMAIQYTEPDTAVLDNPLNPGGPDVIINPAFYNCEVLSRYTFYDDLYKSTETVTDNSFKAFGTVSFNDDIASATYTDPEAIFGYGNITVRPERTPGTWPIEETLQFSDDYTNGFDPSNNYGNGTTQGNSVALADSRYTAPSDGAYTFKFNTDVRVRRRVYDGRDVYEFNGVIRPSVFYLFPAFDGIVGNTYNPEIGFTINHFNSGGSLITQYGADAIRPAPNVFPTSGGNYYLPDSYLSLIGFDSGRPVWQVPFVWDFTMQTSATVGMSTGDYIEIHVHVYRAEVELMDADTLVFDEISLQTQVVETKQIETGSAGGIIQNGDKENTYTMNFSFDGCLDQKTIQGVLEEKNSGMIFNSCLSDGVKGLINEIKINHKTKEASFDLRSKYKRL